MTGGSGGDLKSGANVAVTDFARGSAANSASGNPFPVARQQAPAESQWGPESNRASTTAPDSATAAHSLSSSGVLGGLVDPQVVAQWAPVAAGTGAAALGALPMLAQALSGLGGAPSTRPPATDPTSSTGGNGAVAPVSGAGLSPQAQKAIQVLKLLAAAYGTGATSDPAVAALRQQLGIPVTGYTGNGATALTAQQVYQQNAAKAFTALDDQLATDLVSMAGIASTDRTTIINTVEQVQTAIKSLGTQVYTPAGQQKVHDLLYSALTTAAKTAGNTHMITQAHAADINTLTHQFLNTLAGKSSTGSTSSSPAVEKAISVAEAQIGKPYVWGGAGPDNFDCSGLVQYALAAAGVQVPHGATDQFNMFPKVDPSAIRPADIRRGDLIFPSDEIDSTGYVNHVMIYLGNGQCIAASNPSVPVGVVPLPPGGYKAARWA
ncbi:C40 family peptidase [Nocardia sp.]|uniref:C40 family peptidase n=1 Tax=Nocardia sp. TaxID=1821 RepID=UPI0026274277|nr:C40 family peptidase [Nocardia sp.]